MKGNSRGSIALIIFLCLLVFFVWFVLFFLPKFPIDPALKDFLNQAKSGFNLVETFIIVVLAGLISATITGLFITLGPFIKRKISRNKIKSTGNKGSFW